MSDYLEEAISELRDLVEDHRFLFRGHLLFQIEELENSLDSFKEGSSPHPDPILLRTWLEMNQNSIVMDISLEGVKPTIRLTETMKNLIRGLLTDLHLKRKAHGRISLDNILVCKGTAKLINSLDLNGNADTYRDDFAAIAAVIEDMLGRHVIPKDLKHLLDIIRKQEPLFGAMQAFVFNHPAVWSYRETVQNITCLTCYCYCETSEQTRFRKAASKIPPEITHNWKARVNKSQYRKVLKDCLLARVNKCQYRKVLKDSPKSEELPDGLALLVLFRDALMHADKHFPGRTQVRIQNDLYALFPDFLAHLMEKLYPFANVRDICGR